MVLYIYIWGSITIARLVQGDSRNVDYSSYGLKGVP